METIVIKQEKSKKGIAVAIPIVVAAIHALIRGAYKMSLFDCLIVLLAFALSTVIIVFIVDVICKQTIYIEQDRFIMRIGALSRIYYYKDIDRCIYRNNAYLKLKLKNGKDKELYLGEFDFDSRQQFVSVIKEQKVPFDELSI